MKATYLQFLSPVKPQCQFVFATIIKLTDDTYMFLFSMSIAGNSKLGDTIVKSTKLKTITEQKYINSIIDKKFIGWYFKNSLISHN